MAVGGVQAVPQHDVFGRVWAGRRVVVVGLGRSGQAAARWLCRLGCKVWVTDAHESQALRESGRALYEHGVVSVEFGGHTPGVLEQAEIVVTSPGIPEDSPALFWAEERDVPVISEIELAYLFCPAPVVAVTGTNGKSTAVTLLARILQAAGRHAIACGNLGLPFSAVLDQLTERSVAVVEVSSFQLLRCERFRPRIGVLLNIGTNHLDRHPTHSDYLAAKARMFQCQTGQDWAVLNGADPALRALGDGLPGRRAWFADDAGNPEALRLTAETRRALDAGQQAVLQVARLLRIPDCLSWQAMREFRGLEHRNEWVATWQGRQFVNDSKSTTLDSLRYAVERCRSPLVLIVGGRNKGVDCRPLAEICARPNVRGVVHIGETRPLFRDILAPLSADRPVREAPTLADAVREAARLAAPGMTVLFSPACASFDMFRNFEERGREFKAIVRTMTEESSGGVAMATPGPS